MSEIASQQASSPKLPNKVLAAYMQGNTVLPQTNIGLNVLTGKAFLDVCLDPHVKGDTLFASELLADDDQVAHALRGMRALHSRYNVACSIEESYEARLRGLIGSAVFSAKNAITNFAFINMMDERGRDADLRTETVGRLLFSRNEVGQLVRPEGLALQGIWVATKAAIFSEQGQGAMSSYRSIALGVMDRTSAEFMAARLEVRHTLMDIVDTGIHDDLPQIQANTGVSIDEKAVNMFMYMNGLTT